MFFSSSIKKIFIFIQNHFSSITSINNDKKQNISIILNEELLKMSDFLDTYIKKQNFICSNVLWITSYSFEERSLKNSFYKEKINIIFIKNLSELNQILDILSNFYIKNEVIIFNQISRLNYAKENEFYNTIKNIYDFAKTTENKIIIIDEEELFNSKKAFFIKSIFA